VIELGAIEDNQLLIGGLRAWAKTVPDIRLDAVTATVDGLLQALPGRCDVVLLNPLLRADPDPAVNVRRLIAAGHRVVIVDGSADLGMVARSLAAGAHGYLTRDHDAAALARTLRAIAAGGTAWSPGPARAPGATAPGRPPLSEREHSVLMAYVSGLTLDSAARSLGISPETARTYLKRVKAKYHQIGLPVYTKLDLAQQVRADCTAGTCHLPQGQRNHVRSVPERLPALASAQVTALPPEAGRPVRLPRGGRAARRSLERGPSARAETSAHLRSRPAWSSRHAARQTRARTHRSRRPAPGEPAVRINLNPGNRALAGTVVTVSKTVTSPGEHLLDTIAIRLLLLVLAFPHQIWLHLAALRPGPHAYIAGGLCEVIAALEACGALPPLSPVPGQLAALCANLNITGHGITAPPARTLPEPWLSMLAHYRRRKPDRAPGRDGAAAAFPELDGIRLAILGLHNSVDSTFLHVHAGGMTLDGRDGSQSTEPDFPLRLWVRDSAGRWHATQTGWSAEDDGGVMMRLELVPPLSRATTWIEMLAAGPSGQIRATLPLRWR